MAFEMTEKTTINDVLATLFEKRISFSVTFKNNGAVLIKSKNTIAQKRHSSQIQPRAGAEK
jgi:hypothetical protein